MIQIIGIEYDERFSALINYDSDPYINMEKVREYNIRHTLDEGRIQKLEESKAELNNMVKEWNDAKLVLDKECELCILH